MNSVSPDVKAPQVPPKFGPKKLFMESHCVRRRQARAIARAMNIDRRPGPPGSLTATSLARRKAYADKQRVAQVLSQFSESDISPTCF